MSDDPTDKTREFGIVGNDFRVPFEISGTTIFFKSRVPTRWEMEHCRIIKLTVDPPWNPTEVTIACMQTLTGETLEETTYRTICAIDHSIPRCNVACACHSDLSVYDTSHMIQRMISSVNVATAHRDEPSIAYVGAKDRHSRVTPEAVAKKFRCGLETAQRTLKTTTQRGSPTQS